MKKVLLIFALFCAPLVRAQNITSVSGTVTDSVGTPYVAGTLTVTFINTTGQQALFGGNPNFQKNYNAQLDSTGSFTIPLPSNAVITPSNPTTQWAFNICASDGGSCFSSTITISGASQSVSATLSAASPRITFIVGEKNQPACGTGQTVVAVGTLFGCGAAGSATSLTGPGVISGTFSGNPTFTGNFTEQGNNTHSGTETFTGHISCKDLNGIRCIDSTNTQGWAGADIGAWVNSAIQALPAAPVGGTVILPNAPTMNFSTTINIDRPVHMIGQSCGLNGRGTQLVYTGSGIAISLAANNGSTGSILECFSLDNTGTGTVGIDADSGNYDMRLLNLDVETSVAFSIAQIRIGNTTTGSALVNFVLEGSRVGNGVVGVLALRGNHVTVSRSTVYQNTSHDFQLGDATHALVDFECRNCEMESGTVVNENSILINNVQSATFTDGYAETSQTAATPWLSIPNTATLADNIIFHGWRFKSNAATAQSVASVNFASATLGFEDCYGASFPSNSFFVTNTASRHIWFSGVHSDSSSMSPASSNTGVEYAATAAAGSLLGSRVISLASVGVVNPTSAGAADLGSTSLPWGNLWLGTNATNNFKFAPAATAAARIINIPEFLAASTTMAYNPPPVAGTTDLGTTALPFGNLWLGTAATNNYKFQPAATAASRIIQVNDPGATSALLLGGTNLLISPTAPTIAGAGCGGSAASIVAPNGTAAFKINVGTAPTSACTITMPAATTGWNCFATDITTNSTSVFLQKQTGAESTTSVTITNFSDVAAATAFTANDILKVSCHAD